MADRAAPTYVRLPTTVYNKFVFLQIMVTFLSYISNACHFFSGVATNAAPAHFSLALETIHVSGDSITYRRMSFWLTRGAYGTCMHFANETLEVHFVFPGRTPLAN